MGERRVSITELADELKAVVRPGLPLSEASAGEILPNLRCVFARAVHPRAKLSRLSALEVLLRAALDNLGDNPLGQATRLLFAVDSGLRGSTLTHRRELAAAAMERDPDHFRQNIEPKIRRLVAEELQRLNVLYEPRREGARPPEAISGSTPALKEHDYTEQEELISRIWAAVYGLRAELIATRRLEEDEAASQEHARTGLWQLARLLTVLADYLDRYGETLLHGELEYAAEGVVALAGWSGTLTDKEAQHLRYTLARSGPDDREAFLKRLEGSKAGRDMIVHWTEARP